MDSATETKPPSQPESAIIELTAQLFDLKSPVVTVRELNSYDDRNYQLVTANREEFVLKVTNSADSGQRGLLEGQNEMMAHLEQRGFCVPLPVANRLGTTVVRNKMNGVEYAVRLLKFVPGIRLCEVKIDDRLLLECGEYLAKIDSQLQSFQNVDIRNRKFLWTLESVPVIRSHFNVINDAARVAMVERCVKNFEDQVLAIADTLPQGFIHGDFNEQNILVEEKFQKLSVQGVIDFGDVHYGPLLFDLAILVTYIMLLDTTVDPIREAPNFALRGYARLIPITKRDVELLLICAKARLCQSLILGAYTYSLYPANDYLLVTAKKGWSVLETLDYLDQELLVSGWCEQVALS